MTSGASTAEQLARLREKAARLERQLEEREEFNRRAALVERFFAETSDAMNAVLASVGTRVAGLRQHWESRIHHERCALAARAKSSKSSTKATQSTEILAAPQPPRGVERNDAEEKAARPVVSHAEFAACMKAIVDLTGHYHSSIADRPLRTNRQPGFIFNAMSREAPQNAEPFANILRDVEETIIPGLTHWQHPHFHGYFTLGFGYPDVLAETLASSLGVIGFTWSACPALTEMELAMMNWMGRALGLPESFLYQGDDPEKSPGGGATFDSASEALFCALAAAIREHVDRNVDIRKAEQPSLTKYELHAEMLGHLVAYTNIEANSCVEKACNLQLIRCRTLRTKAEDEYGVRGAHLRREIEKDLERGLVPCFVCCTIGTTSTVTNDFLDEIWPVAKEYDLWLHVDAAYGGAGWLCPEFRSVCKGLEHATSVCVNAHKMLLQSPTMSYFWTTRQEAFKAGMRIDPTYLRQEGSKHAPDLRDWGINMSRRFKALKTWFLFRMYGVSGLQNYVRNICDMAEYFLSLVKSDERLSIFSGHKLGLFCFQFKGPNHTLTNVHTQNLWHFINNSRKLYFTHTEVDGHDLIRVAIVYEKTTRAIVDDSWSMLRDLIDQQSKGVGSGRGIDTDSRRGRLPNQGELLSSAHWITGDHGGFDGVEPQRVAVAVEVVAQPHIGTRSRVFNSNTGDAFQYFSPA